MKVTIQTKLYAGFMAVMLLLGIISAISYIQISSVDSIHNQLLDNRVKKMLLIKDLFTAMEKQEAAARGYLVMATDKQMQAYDQAKDEYNKISKQLGPTLREEQDKQRFNDLIEIAVKFDEASQHVFYQRSQNDPLYQQSMKTLMQPEVEDFSKKSEIFVQSQQKKLDQEIQNTSKTVSLVKMIILAVTAVSLVIALLISFFISKSIINPIKALNVQLKEIAEGEADLTKNIVINSKDEMGEFAHNFNKMLAKLRELVKQVVVTSTQVAAASEQLTTSAEQSSKATESITASLQEVASGTESQVGNMDESSTAIHDMAERIQTIATHAQNMTDSMKETDQTAKSGNLSIEKAVVQMGDIHTTVEQLGNEITELGKNSTEIGKIVEVISEIAAQTNLLALNAAIEAARAGEHGRGFSVVADEVRKLAEQSALSAKQIGRMILMNQDETEKAVNSMNVAIQKVEQGIGVVQETGSAFDRITRSVSQVAGQVQEVSSSVQEMAAGTEQIVQSIEKMKMISEEAAIGTQNISAAAEEQAASMEEIAGSSKSLESMAESLQSQIGKFKV